MDYDDGLALAIANSVGPPDRLGTPSALRSWLDEHRVDSGTARDAVLLRVGEFRSLRDHVRTALARAVESLPIPDDVVDELNAASAGAPTWPLLRVEAGTAALAIATSDTSETTTILASFARSAIELLGGPDAARLRKCPACGRFFLASRPRQMWCSGACGNRTRVARHRSRRDKVGA
ncbi:MAG TPA: ABATE domain-containing protein [Actinomycetota bacterium]|jgi:predicted RNA-binding Zn ribbon-like protein|nr:ABATE domain-containing protein [Actinomycetota bacterium]